MSTSKLRRVNDLDEYRWSVVQNRDASAAGSFVYGVVSTRIYCRPGCASRQPLRRNVEFFSTPAEATAAGYRACRRCRPEEHLAHDPGLEAIIELCRRMERIDATVDIAAFAAQCGYNERHLRRRFTEVVGVPPATYVRIQRAERARDTLRSTGSVTQSINDAGYGSSRAFYEHGAPQLGMTPRQYRTGGDGERIAYTSLVTPIGVVIAAATARGVCAVRIGSDESALVHELMAEFPSASLCRDDDGLSQLVDVLASAVRGECDASTLPIDLAGTAFQARVWNVLRKVPSGETLTYAEVAKRIGSPRAVRAVGSACAANPAAIVVPCHRVVRSDGALGGYRWGLATKSTLLEVERDRRRDLNP